MMEKEITRVEVTYKYRLDVAYQRVVIDRYYRQKPWYLRLWGQFGLIAAAILYFYWFGGRSIGLSPSEIASKAIPLALAIFVGGIFLTKWGIVAKFWLRPYFGLELTVRIDDKGLVSEGNHQQGSWTWDAYPQAVRYPDGILLMRSGVIRWLADAAIRSGTAERATTLVSSKTPLRYLKT